MHTKEGVTIKKTKVSTFLFSYYGNNEWILSADSIPSLFFDFDNKMILFYDVAHIHPDNRLFKFMNICNFTLLIIEIALIAFSINHCYFNIICKIDYID